MVGCWTNDEYQTIWCFPSRWTARLGFNEDWLNDSWLVSNYNIRWMTSTLELIYSYGFSPDWLLFPIRTCDLLQCHSTLEWPSFQYVGRKSLFRHQINQNVLRVVNGLVWLTRLLFSASIRLRVLWAHISHARFVWLTRWTLTFGSRVGNFQQFDDFSLAREEIWFGCCLFLSVAIRVASIDDFPLPPDGDFYLKFKMIV